MKIRFTGAVRTVTGSCHFLEIGDFKLLVDCGMYQGINIEGKNHEDFTFDPKEIDAVLLTHSHLDHCGRLPKLYKKGFRGKVYCTHPTRDISELILFDSAKVQQIKYKEYQRNKHKKKDKGKFSQNIPHPIYTTKDVSSFLNHMVPIDFNNEFHLNNDIKAVFIRAGHALGAASVKLIVDDTNEKKNIIFSGDLGNKTETLDSEIDYPKDADYVIMESLYGNKNHADRSKSEKKFIEMINKTLSRGGNVIVPAFSLQRSQEILYTLRRFIEKNQIPTDTKIYFDSPLAIRITEVYKKYYDYLNPKVVSRFRSGGEIFDMKNIIFIPNHKKSMRIQKQRGSIIVAGSGMCTGGRVIYHLAENLPDKRSSVVIVGFQAEGTLGREIVEGARKVKIGSKNINIKADILRLFTFSAHADKNHLMEWLGGMDKEKIKKVFLIHGEAEISKSFYKYLLKENYPAILPHPGDGFNL